MKYNIVFITTPIEDEKGIIATYQVHGLSGTGLKYICTLKEDIIPGTIFRYTKPSITTPTARYEDLRTAIYALREEFIDSRLHNSVYQKK